MSDKAKKDPADTYIFSDEVLDEMENLEATAEMAGLEELPQDDDAADAADAAGKKRPLKDKDGDNS